LFIDILPSRKKGRQNDKGRNDEHRGIVLPCIVLPGHARDTDAMTSPAAEHNRSASSRVGASAMARTMGSVLLARTNSQRLGVGKAGLERGNDRRNPALVDGELGLVNCVPRQFVGELAEAFVARRHRIQDQRHADKAVAHVAHAGVDRTAVAFAAEHGLSLAHQARYVSLSDR
jgi:hypothetical protein